jgi:hypothetical protein
MNSILLGNPIAFPPVTQQQQQFNILANSFNSNANVDTLSVTWGLDKTVTSPNGTVYTLLPAGFLYSCLVFLYNGLAGNKFVTNAVLANQTVVDYLIECYDNNVQTLAQAQGQASYASAQAVANA